MKFFQLLDGYMLGRMNEKELYELVKTEFNVLFEQNRFRELEYLKIYPFISELQDEDLYEKDILREKINNIIDICNGHTFWEYDMWMDLLPCDMKAIKQIWKNYIEKDTLSFEEYNYLNKKLQEVWVESTTVENICLKKILVLLVGLPIRDDGFYTHNLLYSKGVEKDIICEDVDKLIHILEGKRSVHLLLEYNHEGGGVKYVI